MNNYCGGPTWLQWVKQVLDKINEVIERINSLTSDVMNVRQLPSGGSHGQVATPTEDGSGYEWVDQTGGGGGGETPTITVGSTTTGAPGTNASVDAEQVSGGVVLNFTIPRGNPGEKGADGKTPVVSVSGTDTGEPGTNANVESRATADGIALRFTIPRGADGSDGTPGVGVPAGGTAGQVLAKVDGTDYNTQWVDQTGGGGETPTITVGSTTTGAPGTNASVDAEQVSGGVVLNFTIPRGNPGEKGADGKTPVVSVSGTDTGEPGTPAIVESSSTADGIALRFTIPRGADGSDGTPGVGVPAGGTAGQVLAKVDGTDYNTQWVDQTGGGGSGGTVWEEVPLVNGQTVSFDSITCKVDRENPLHIQVSGCGNSSGNISVMFNKKGPQSTFGVPVLIRFLDGDMYPQGFGFGRLYYNQSKYLMLYCDLFISKSSNTSSWTYSTSMGLSASGRFAFSFEGYLPTTSSPIGDVPIDPGESGPGEM